MHNKYGYFWYEQKKKVSTTNYLVPIEGKQIPEVAQDIVGSNQSHISSRDWKRHKLPEAMAVTKQWWVGRSLYLEFNQQKMILSQIYNVRFPNVKALFLKKNLIETIEILPRIFMPNLEVIHTDINNLTTLRSLRKLNLPQLVNLVFTQNKVSQLDWMTACFCPKLEYCRVRAYFDEQLAENYYFFVKLQSNQKMHLEFYDNKTVLRTNENFREMGQKRGYQLKICRDGLFI